MENLTWSPEMEMDIPIVDSAHRRFLRNLSAIASAPDTEFIRKYFLLIEELESDFKDEEDLMEASQFFDSSPHREQHARVLYALHKVIPDVLSGNYSHAKETLELLPKWFIFHLSTMDRLLSIWFKLKKTDMTLDTYSDDQNSITSSSSGLRNVNQSRTAPMTREV